MSTLKLTFLGTSAAAPTERRNVSGLFVKRAGDSMLFDCGEGSQRQMLRFRTGFSIKAVFFTHFHADHYLGIIGFLRTLGMHGRTEPLELYGPKPARSLLARAIRLGVDGMPVPVSIVELAPGQVVERDGFRVEAFGTEHRVASLGYAIVEDSRPGRVDAEKARALGVPSGPLMGKLQRGEPVVLPSGTEIPPSLVVGPMRPGRRVVISGDTRPCNATVAAAKGADLLVHEATFGDDESERAVLTGHSTAREAARIAREAGAQRLVLTHLSSRYELRPDLLEKQAKEELQAVSVADDGTELDVPLID